MADGIYRAWKYGEKGQGYIISGSVQPEDIIRAVSRLPAIPRRKVPRALVSCIARAGVLRDCAKEAGAVQIFHKRVDVHLHIAARRKRS